MTEMSKKLRRRMPANAVRPNPGSGLSAVNPMYVIERLNDVFGEDGWEAQFTVVEAAGQMVVVKCDFRADRTIRRQTFGGNASADRGDAYKGACTDALTKAASWIGIASHVYKGLDDPTYIVPAAARLSKSINGKQYNELMKVLVKSGKKFEDLTRHLRGLGVDTAPGFKIPSAIYESLLTWAQRKEKMEEAF